MAIWGGGLFGNSVLGGRATDSVYLSTSSLNPFTLHEEPVNVMREILNQTAPAYVNSAFAWNCSAAPVNKTGRPWLFNKYPAIIIQGLLIRGRYEVQLSTDGGGGISEMKHFNPATKEEVVLP